MNQMKPLLRFFTVAFLLLAALPAAAQFGQNKIAYDRFHWKMYESPHFDIFYYDEEEPFLEDVVSYAESNYDRISGLMDHELRFRVPLIIYKTHQEFRQTNITLQELPDGVQAFAEPVQNRMVLPIDEPPDKLFKLIGHELTHIFQYSIYFEGYLGRAVRSNPPTWLFEGMASYMSNDEDNFDKMVIRDAVVNNFLPPIQAFSSQSFYAYRYGHAAFDFIEQEYGKEGLHNFIYEYRKVLLSNNLGKAVKDTFGYDLEEFNRRFNRYLRKKYFPILLDKKSPDDYGPQIGVKKGRRQLSTFNPAISPSGELIAAFSTPKPEMDLVILSAADGKVIRNLTKGYTNHYEKLETDMFSGRRSIAWSPVSDEIAVFVRKEGRRRLYVFNALTGKVVHNVPFPDLYQSGSPAWSPDGRKIAFHANRKGVVDLFEYDLDSHSLTNLTQDDFFDTNPWYSADGKSLLYNRRIGEFWKIFSVDRDDPSRKTQITFGPYTDIQPSYNHGDTRIYFSSDRDPNGVFNIYSIDLATGELTQHTDVVGGCLSPIELLDEEEKPHLIFNAFYAGGFRLYRMPVDQPDENRIPSTPVSGGESPETAREAEIFEPPLKLGLDEDRKKPFRNQWDIEAPSVAVGVANDGTFLTNSFVRFSDLLGDRRVLVSLQSVSNFTNSVVQYLNLKHRYNWGAVAFDQRDYFLRSNGGNLRRDQAQRVSGANLFGQQPLSRFYRLEGSVGILDSSQDIPTGIDSFGLTTFTSVGDTFATAGITLTGDTTRYMPLGPAQGKKIRLAVFYGNHLSGDIEGDILQYDAEFRAYRQITPRSTLAFRFDTTYSAGDRENFRAIGGINELRGYDFREFFGSRVAIANLELRFPLLNALPFAFGNMGPVQGFLFMDLGAAWFGDDRFYDPDFRADIGLGGFRIDPVTGEPITFSFWDGDNNRLQDGRGSYGYGFKAFILGLQLNWVWSRRLPYTQYQLQFDPVNGFATGILPVKADTGGSRMDFYIVYDF